MTGSMRAARTLVAPSRVLLATKTAGAAVLAWYLAPLIPFAADEYSYYAPLGVVVSMYPTLADSARSSVQTVLGLAIGIGFGLVAVGLDAAGVPAAVALAAIVAVGVLLGGARVLGPGREWIVMAALFVLLIGGRGDPDQFSVSYLVTMAFGIVVGVAVNVLIAPPVFLPYASRRLSELRDTVAARLDEMADAVGAGGVDHDALAASMSELSTMLLTVADEVREADRSLRGNPRGRRQAAAQEENARRLRALEHVTFFARDLADILGRIPPTGAPLRGEARTLLAEAVRACRDVVATAPGDRDTTALIETAGAAVEGYLASLEPVDTGIAELAETVTAGVSLRRMIDACRPFA
jgi:hypothetical protein